MTKVNFWAAGTALAITMSVAYTVCAVAFTAFPEGTIGFFNSWFHGLDLSALRSPDRPFTVYAFLSGLFGIAVVSFLIGAVYALVYNVLSRYADQDQPQTGRFAR